MPYLISILLIYPFKLSFFPSLSTLLLLSMCVFFFIRIGVYNRGWKINAYIIIYINILLILVALNVMSIIYNGTNDLSYINMVFKYLTIIFISINVVCYCIIKNIDLFDFLRSFIVVSAILASFCIGEYFSPYIKHMISTYFISTDNIIYSETFRVKGFVSGGGAKLSFCLALAVMFSHALYVEKKNNLLILLSLIISVGALLVGRTGMVLTFISWFALLAITIGKPTIKSVSILTLVIVIILVGINNLDFSSDELKMVHQYSFELLYNYQETGKFSSKSTDAISNMYIMPNWNVILFGNGTFSYDGIINVIDVGYYKQLFSTGIIGFFLFYFSIGWGQYVSYKYICLNVNKVFCFIIFVSFWVVEAKEPIFLHGYSSRVLLMVFLFSVLDGRIINNEKK